VAAASALAGLVLPALSGCEEQVVCDPLPPPNGRSLGDGDPVVCDPLPPPDGGDAVVAGDADGGRSGDARVAGDADGTGGVTGWPLATPPTVASS